MRAIVIDDSKQERKSLVMDIEAYCPDIEVVAESYDPIKGIQQIHKYDPDIVFLDIELEHPEINGITLLKLLGGNNIRFQTIFVTKHSDFALDAIRLNACHYLLKPIQREELMEAVQRVSDRIANPEDNPQTPTIPDDTTIVLPPNARIRHFLKIEQIVCFKQDGNNCEAILNCNESETIHLWGVPLHIPERLLENKGFIRCHNKYLVNKQHIVTYDRPNRELTMCNGGKIPVARGRDGFLSR